MSVHEGSPVLLREVELENFLSFEKARVELGKLTVLIGPNASGKSNFVKALLFLHFLSREPVIFIPSRLGLSDFKRLIYRFDIKRCIRMRAKALIGRESVEHEISISSDAKVLSEVIRHDGDVVAQREGDEVELSISGEKYTIEPSSSLLVLGSIELARHLPSVEAFLEIFRRFRAYSFDPSAIRGESPSGHNVELSPDGSNLAQVLHSLLTYDRVKKFFPIEETLRSFVPEILELDAPTTEDGKMTYIMLREKGLPEPLHYENISDGTLRLLAFITAVHLGSPLVAFEEPENCVHPHLLRALIDLCRYGPSQVIITTHSPYLVDHLTLEKLRLVVKHEGRTEIRAITGEQRELVRKMLEEGFTLGELWYDKVLGENA